MIFQRIRLGAQRTATLFRLSLRTPLSERRARVVPAIRSLTPMVLAAHVAVAPIPVFIDPNGVVLADDGSVPDTQRVAEETFTALHVALPISPTPLVTAATLQGLSLGTSVAAARAAAEAEAKRLADAQAAEEAARQRALIIARQREKALAAARAAAQAVPQGITAEKASIVDLARSLTVARFGEAQWPYMFWILNTESGFNPNARNARSGACGIPQALPCSKLRDFSVQGQLQWAVNYVAGRYGTPEKAALFKRVRGYY